MAGQGHVGVTLEGHQIGGAGEALLLVVVPVRVARVRLVLGRGERRGTRREDVRRLAGERHGERTGARLPEHGGHR
jgi:hypothetical protein